MRIQRKAKAPAAPPPEHLPSISSAPQGQAEHPSRSPPAPFLCRSGAVELLLPASSLSPSPCPCALRPPPLRTKACRNASAIRQIPRCRFIPAEERFCKCAFMCHINTHLYVMQMRICNIWRYVSVRLFLPMCPSVPAYGQVCRYGDAHLYLRRNPPMPSMLVWRYLPRNAFPPPGNPPVPAGMVYASAMTLIPPGPVRNPLRTASAGLCQILLPRFRRRDSSPRCRCRGKSVILQRDWESPLHDM